MKHSSPGASRSFWIAFAALVLLGGVLRFWNLGTIPTDPREVGSAAVSARILQTGEYRHNPLTHGPLLYYLDAAAFVLGGVSIPTARAVAALAGMLLPLAFLPFRRYLGGGGVLAAAGLYALSPTEVAVAHLNTPDTLLMFLDLLVLAAVLRFLETGDRRAFLAGALLFGLSATAKEQTFLNAFLAIAAAVVLAALRPEWVVPLFGPEAGRGRGSGVPGAARRGAFRAMDELLGGLLWFAGRHRKLLLQGLLLFLATFALLYTAFLTFLPGLLLGFLQLVIWATGTVSTRFLEDFYGPPGYYLPLLARFDLVLALLGILGGVWAWRRGRRFEVFLLVLGVLLFAFFSLIPYKNAKLLVYPLLPWTLAAGSFVAHLARSAGVRRFAAGAACALVVVQSVAGLPGVLAATPDPRYVPLEEMTGILEESTRTHPDAKAFIFSPSQVSVPLVDTSYYLIWGTRHLKDQPVVARVLQEAPGQLSLRTVPSGFLLCGLQPDPRGRTYRAFSDLPPVAVALRNISSNNTSRPDVAWGLCASELLRATEYPVVGTTGNLALLFDPAMLKAGYVKVSMNTTLSGPLVAYIPGRLASENREVFARYSALNVEWLPGPPGTPANSSRLSPSSSLGPG